MVSNFHLKFAFGLDRQTQSVVLFGGSPNWGDSGTAIKASFSRTLEEFRTHHVSWEEIYVPAYERFETGDGRGHAVIDTLQEFLLSLSRNGCIRVASDCFFLSGELRK